jgi:hypothetical protein
MTTCACGGVPLFDSEYYFALGAFNRRLHSPECTVHSPECTVHSMFATTCNSLVFVDSHVDLGINKTGTGTGNGNGNGNGKRETGNGNENSLCRCSQVQSHHQRQVLRLWVNASAKAMHCGWRILSAAYPVLRLLLSAQLLSEAEHGLSGAMVLEAIQ